MKSLELDDNSQNFSNQYYLCWIVGELIANDDKFVSRYMILNEEYEQCAWLERMQAGARS